jgi:hypothetical protein
MAGETPSTDARARPQITAAAVPVIFASVLGFLYFIGAFLKTAELHGAGISVRDALPLVPIPYLLARGIGAILSSFVIWLVVLLYAGAIYLLMHRVELRLDRRRGAYAEELGRAQSLMESLRRLKPDEGDLVARTRARIIVQQLRALGRELQPPSGRLLLAFSFAMSLLTLATFATLPPLMAAGMIVATFAAVFLRGRMSRGRRLLLLFGISGVAFLINFFVEPQPLPKVTLTTNGRASVTGRLITSTADTWYLTGLRHSIIAVPSDRVRHAGVAHQPQRHWENGLQLIGVDTAHAWPRFLSWPL